MSIEIIAWLKSELARLEGSTAVRTVETDAENIGSAAWSLIKTQGLQDIYNIAESALLGAVAGAPWAGTLTAIETAAVAAGKALEKSTIAVIGAQAQADLIAAGKLLPPTTATAA